MKNENEKRSPLKSYPLRYPGQSLDEKIWDIIFDKVLMHIMLFGLIFLTVIFEWIKYYLNMPPIPITVTFFALIISIYSGNKIYGYWKEIKNLKLGRDGEKIVGESLEKLRKKGYEVFHDIVPGEFNIDHIIVGSAGAFTIETKTISKAKKGNPMISYDGIDIKIDGIIYDKNPILQAKGQAYWLENFINERAKLKVKVKPVIIYPGWYVDPKSNGRDVWVLNEKSLPVFLDNEKISLNAEQINLIASHLESYDRNYSEDK